MIGNEAPEISVEALLAADGETDPLSDDKRVGTPISRKCWAFPTRVSVDRDAPKGPLGTKLKTSILNHCLIGSQLCETEHVP